MINYKIPVKEDKYDELKNKLRDFQYCADFDDSEKKVHLKTGIQGIINIPAVKNALRDAEVFDSTNSKVMKDKLEEYITDEFKTSRDNLTAVNEARNSLRENSGEDSFDQVSVEQYKDSFGEPESAVNNILKDDNVPGVCLGRNHKDKGSLDLANKVIGKGDVKVLFVEEFPEEEQQVIDEYLDSNYTNDEFPTALKERVQYLKQQGVDWGETLREAKKNGVSVYGIDSLEAREKTLESSWAMNKNREHRVAMMNAVSKRVMDNALKKHPNQKFMAIVGAQHSHTHSGGIPGMAQLNKMAVLKMEDGVLEEHKEDKSLRGMPSEREQQYIDKIVEMNARFNSTDYGNETKLDELRQQAQKDAAKLKDQGVIREAIGDVKYEIEVHKEIESIGSPKTRNDRNRLATLRKRLKRLREARERRGQEKKKERSKLMKAMKSLGDSLKKSNSQNKDKSVQKDKTKSKQREGKAKEGP